ncbi:hypothetical protein M2480_002959 [Parabacteroides sp. PFB2-12]|uniref:hypothetical protein n=1 Tax=unclassified Parabacteroides TaxID=2649774 RepID=UPI002473080D|nr:MULTISPECIES: hypothetical protein [unclassified Parabacteroides]MDH6343794.1 hypothetical protein [Parabacteroides sp. PM6-13]MDH6391956.1 hypothetical protein [Parabacteroides sp. PFB2-12]
MKYQLNQFSDETIHCSFKDILEGKVQLAPFYGDPDNDWAQMMAYLEKIYQMTQSSQHPLYRMASSSLSRMIEDKPMSSAFLDCGDIDIQVVGEEDYFIKEQLRCILPIAYKERYAYEDADIPDFKQVSDGPHECTVVATCKGRDGQPTVLASIRLDFNPQADDLEISRFFTFDSPVKNGSAEFCRFAYHPVFDLWVNSANPHVRHRATLIRGILIRYMYMKGFLVHVQNLKSIDILCTMTRNIVLFVKRISGFSLVPIEGACVNPDSDYFRQESEKYPKYFIPKLMGAYYFDFDIEKANMVLPKDMVNTCKQKRVHMPKVGGKQYAMAAYGA